jgi:hypothetical protein
LEKHAKNSPLHVGLVRKVLVKLGKVDGHGGKVQRVDA